MTCCTKDTLGYTERLCAKDSINRNATDSEKVEGPPKRLICKVLLDFEKGNQLFFLKAKDMNCEFTEEETQMTNTHEKMLNNEEMQIAAKMRHHFTLLRSEKRVCKHQMLPRTCESRNSNITGGSVTWCNYSREQFGNT